MVVSKTDLADWVDEKAAAEYLRLSVSTLQADRSRGLPDCWLPRHMKIGRRVVYAREELEACQRARLQHPKLARKFHKQETQQDAVA